MHRRAHLCGQYPWHGVEHSERPDAQNDAERTQTLGMRAKEQRVADRQVPKQESY